MPHRTGYLYDDIFLEHELSSGHPESPLRLAALHAMVTQSGLLEKMTVVPFDTDIEKAKKPAGLVHTEEHIENVFHRETTGNAALAAIAAVCAAVDAVMEKRVDNAFCAIRPPGHHAHNDINHDGYGMSEGFCFLNNVAVAVRHAQKTHGLKNILILDWDFHHGHGTEDCFYDDPGVFYYSSHRLPTYPGTGYAGRIGEGTGVGCNLNVPLPSPDNPYGMVRDDDLTGAFERHLLPQLDKLKFKPEFVFVSAGFDGREDDYLGNFDITDEGFARVTKMSMEIAERFCGGRIVSVLEGGYNPVGVAAAGMAHLRTLLGER